jgi:aminopeptidase N
MPILDPYSLSDPSQGKIVDIAIQMAVDFSARRIHCNARYALDRAVRGAFFLDTKDIDIEKLQADGKEIPWEMENTGDILGQRLIINDLGGAEHFSITYAPSKEARALQWLTPQQTAGGTHPFLYTQCQQINARSILPCQDTPSVRFTYRAEIQIPDPLVAVMAAAPEEVQVEQSQRTYSFHMPQAIPSYLFAFAIGDLTHKEISHRCRVYAEPEMVEAAAWEYAETEAQLSRAEEILGPYLWDRYDLLVMPPAFPYGGMENPRLTFVSPSNIVGDRSETDLIAHELAHSWTGNLITNATWGDFWLNEGWTTYAERRISEKLRGRDYVQLTNVIGYRRLLRSLDLIGKDSDLSRLKVPQESSDPEISGSWVPYYKGCFFLMSVEEAVGREAFDPFIRKYVNTFQFQSLTTETFLEFMSEELPDAPSEVSIEDWVYDPGYPAEAPIFQSALYDEVKSAVSLVQDGHRPAKKDIDNWLPEQRYLFLQMLPRELSAETCRHLDDLFDFQSSPSYLIRTTFYASALRSGWEEVLPAAEEILGEVGRILLLTPIFYALAETDWSREIARPLFERLRPRYHPICQAAIERLLSNAGV